MNLRIYLSLLLLLLASQVAPLNQKEINEHQVTYLHVGKPEARDALTLLQSIYTRNMVHIYCRRDQRLRWSNIFQSNRLQLWIDDPNMEYKQYKGNTPKEVYHANLCEQQCHEGKLLADNTRQLRSVSLSAHSHSCYGIYTDRAYNLTLLQQNCDKERLARFLIGLTVWSVAPMLSDSLISCYVLASVLGVHLTALCLVCISLLVAGDHQLQALHPIGGNFNLILEQYPSAVALTLMAGAWLWLRTCQRNRRLWRHQFVRRFHFRITRFISYLFILGASDSRNFGLFCMILLLPWPEIWWITCWCRTQCVKVQRKVLPPSPRRLLNNEEFQVQINYETQRAMSDLRQRLLHTSPSWEQMAQLRAPLPFARFISSGDLHQPELEPEPQREPTRRASRSSGTSSREVQTTPQDNAHTVLEQLAVAINSANTPFNNSSDSSSSSSGSKLDDACSSTIESFYRNQHFQGSARSLRDSPQRI